MTELLAPAHLMDRRGFWRRVTDFFRPSSRELNPFGVTIQPNWSISGEPPLISSNTPRDYNAAYARVPYLFACINAIAEDCAAYKWKLYANDEVIEQPWPQELDVWRTPNHHQTWHDLKFILFVDLVLHGDCYCYWSGTRFEWLPAFLTRAIPDTVDGVAGYVLQSGANKIEFDIDEVVHAAIPGPGLMVDGMSPLDPLTDTINKFGYEVAYERALFKNNATPSGALSTDKTLTEEQKQEALKNWERRHSGAAKASRVAILTGGMSFTPYSMTSKDAGLNEAKEYDRREIQAVFGVPDTRIAQKGINYATATTEMFMYRLSVVFPKIDRVDAAFNRIVAPNGGFRVESDRSGDYWITAQRAEMFDTAIRATGNQPVATQNEVRSQLLNLPMLDDAEADKLYPLSPQSKWEQAARMTGWRQVLTQNEARGIIGYGKHDDVEADEVNKAPPQFFPALGVTPNREPFASEIEEIGAAAGEPTTESASADGVQFRTHDGVDVLAGYDDDKREMLTRHWSLRVARHFSSVERERRICRKVLAVPLMAAVLDGVKRAVAEKVAEAERVEQSTGKPPPSRDMMPQLPAAGAYDERARELGREYVSGAIKRVGEVEFEALKKQKRDTFHGDVEVRQGEENLDDAFDLFDPVVTGLLTEREQEIQQIPRHLLDDLHLMIAGRLEGGDTIKDISDDLADEFEQLFEWKATQIARTEAGTATNGATWAAMTQSHVSTKRWLQAQVGQKKRLTHTANMDAGAIPFGARFPANNMMFPQEQGAPAGEVVNCMCVLVAEDFEENL